MSGFCIQGKYEGVWECVTHEDSKLEAAQTKIVYDVNEPNPHRIRPESKCPNP